MLLFSHNSNSLIVDDWLAICRVGVRLGEFDTTKDIDCIGSVCADPVVYMGVEAVIPHENYNEKSRNRVNDIGLIRMNGEVYYTDFIKPICMPSSVTYTRSAPNAKYVSVGWGRTLKGKHSYFAEKISSIIPTFLLNYRTNEFHEAESRPAHGGPSILFGQIQHAWHQYREHSGLRGWSLRSGHVRRWQWQPPDADIKQFLDCGGHRLLWTRMRSGGMASRLHASKELRTVDSLQPEAIMNLRTRTSINISILSQFNVPIYDNRKCQSYSCQQSTVWPVYHSIVSELNFNKNSCHIWWTQCFVDC